MEELDKLLEKDALMLMNMKRDLEETQKQEITKSFGTLQSMQKEHDTLKRENNLREKCLHSKVDSYLVLEEMVGAGKSIALEGQLKIDEMNTQLDELQEVLSAELRTTKILNKISGRLETEIVNLQVETQSLTDRVEVRKQELKVTEGLMRSSQQELQRKEAQLDKLIKTVSEREVTRKSKMKALHSIVQEGETSVAKIQQSVMEASQLSEFEHYNRGTPKIMKG